MSELISVVVPIYNVENFLCECIESIINQTYKKLEIILVNDGSTDKSLQICKKYALKDSRIQIVNKNNGGLSSARNAGLKVAKGKYVTFIDSDDYVNIQFIEILYNACVETNCEIAMCSYIQTSGQHNFYESIKKAGNKILSYREALTPNNSKWDTNIVVAWGKLYKIELWKDISYPVGKFYEDAATTYKLIYATKNIVYIDNMLYYYRIRNGSIMNRKYSLKEWDCFEITYERYLFYLKNNENELAQYTILHYLGDILYHYDKCEEMINKKDLRKTLLKMYRNNINKVIHINQISILGKLKYITYAIIPKVYILVKTYKNKKNN